MAALNLSAGSMIWSAVNTIMVAAGHRVFSTVAASPMALAVSRRQGS
jgi:ABC-type spermidine/putrescine transport system permease subunit II